MQAYLPRTQSVEKMTRERHDAGQIAVTKYTQSRYYTLQAELWLQEEKARPENGQ